VDYEESSHQYGHGEGAKTESDIEYRVGSRSQKKIQDAESVLRSTFRRVRLQW
jgi:hypothetical protein